MSELKGFGQSVPIEKYQEIVDGYVEVIRSHNTSFQILVENGLVDEYLKRRYTNAQSN